MKCEEFHSHIHDVVSGVVLEDHRLNQLNEHLDECESCRLIHEQMHSMKASVRNVMRVQAPRELKSTISSLFDADRN